MRSTPSASQYAEPALHFDVRFDGDEEEEDGLLMVS
jgi:hypothetical protein